jgi:Proteobacterial lipase chaperone protein
MKKSLLIAVSLGATMLLGAVLFSPDPQPDLTAAPEQGALRHQLAQRLERGETNAEDELLARYQSFLAADASLLVLFDEREQLRQQSFTPAEQDQLFAEDRLMEQWTLRRKALAETSEADKKMLADELDLWLAEQPQWFREAEANSRLLGDLQALEPLTPAERDAVLLERLGPEAMDRLHQLEQGWQGFERQLAGYLAELKPLPALARAEQQQEILARWFPAEQWRRVEALTRLQFGE